MPERIEPGRLLTELESRRIIAALVLAGLDQKTFAAREKLGYSRLNRMLTRREVVTPDYAQRLNRVVRQQFRPLSQAA